MTPPVTISKPFLLLLDPKKFPLLLSAPALHSTALEVTGASRGSCADTAAPPSQPQLLRLPGHPLADLPAQRGPRSRPEDGLNMGRVIQGARSGEP